MKNRHLDVYYHGKQVGTLAETPDRKVAFQYSAGWIKNGFTISPLSLPLNDMVFVPKDSARECFRGLFGVFADSLPDAWGELLLDMHLSSIGIDPGDISVLDRLAYIGESGMGALCYFPANNTDFNMEKAGLDYDEIAKECGMILSSKDSDRLDILYELGGSSGGTRPKILLREDGEDWIVKFPAKKDPAISGKREYDYSICAKKCGIIMTDTALVPSKICDGYFKTKRFDREHGEKLLTLTFAALLEADFRAPSCDYATFMKAIQVLTKDNRQDKEQMFLTMCFNALSHNRDDHTKNFSFIYTADYGWRLAPAYDLTYSDTYFGEHTTSINGKGRDFQDEDMMTVGKNAGLQKKFCSEALRQVKEGINDLESYLSRKALPGSAKVSWIDRLGEL